MLDAVLCVRCVRGVVSAGVSECFSCDFCEGSLEDTLNRATEALSCVLGGDS